MMMPMSGDVESCEMVAEWLVGMGSGVDMLALEFNRLRSVLGVR